MGKLKLELAVEHVLYIFLFFVPLLRREDLKHLSDPSEAPNAKAKGGKEAHLDGRIETQCLSPFPSFHAGSAYARAILIRSYKKGGLSTEETEHFAETYKSNTLRISCIFVCFAP